MKMKALGFAAVMLALTGCTSVSYNGGKSQVKNVDFPTIGSVNTASVGEQMLSKGMMYQENVLNVAARIDGVGYQIPAGQYIQIGYDNKQDFYTPLGVTKNPFADPITALTVLHDKPNEVCVVTVFGSTSCYDGQLSQTTRSAVAKNSYQQTLLYSGRIGDKINISYREFSNDMARPAFNNDVEYDLSASDVIGYKGASIQVMQADNSSITYRVLRNFN